MDKIRYRLTFEFESRWPMNAPDRDGILLAISRAAGLDYYLMMRTAQMDKVDVNTD